MNKLFESAYENVVGGEHLTKPLLYKVDHPEECPNACNHEYGPENYAEWLTWAHQMRKTHTQKRCSGCGLWFIWEENTP